MRRRKRRESSVDIYYLIKQAQYNNVVTLLVSIPATLGGIGLMLNDSWIGYFLALFGALVTYQSITNIFKLRKQLEKLLRGDKDVNASIPNAKSLFWFNNI